MAVDVDRHSYHGVITTLNMVVRLSLYFKHLYFLIIRLFIRLFMCVSEFFNG